MKGMRYYPSTPNPQPTTSDSWSPSIHSSSYVPAIGFAPIGSIQPHAPAPEWMAITLNDTATGLATIEGIDLDAEIPCLLNEHPADLLVRARCPQCLASGSGGICRAHWVELEPGTQCYSCDWTGDRDAAWTILEVLR